MPTGCPINLILVQYSKEMGMTPQDYFGNLDTAYRVMAEQLKALPSDVAVVPQNLFVW